MKVKKSYLSTIGKMLLVPSSVSQFPLTQIILSPPKSKLAQCEGDLSEQHRLYHLMRDERDRLHGELVHTRHQLSRLTHEHTRLLTHHAPLEEQLRKGQEETKTHLDRINHLTLSCASVILLLPF